VIKFWFYLYISSLAMVSWRFMDPCDLGFGVGVTGMDTYL
jgi:hypothetical protein